MAKTRNPLKDAAWQTHGILKATMPHLTYNQVLYAMRQKAKLGMPFEDFETLVKKLGALARKRRLRRIIRSINARKGKKND